MTTTHLSPIRLQTRVDVPAARAFQVFVDRFDQIKPREQNLLSSPIAETVLEPHVGGAVYDRGDDGSTCRWGTVLAFDTPHRIVIAWLLSPDYTLINDPEAASEVEFRFTDLADGGSTVAVEHRHLERHGEDGNAFRDGLAADDGWPLWLHRYVAALTEGSS